ncbi:MAG: triphosphoribosyl-dephospho-CoA synthase [candidate division NC10 bacterium]|nr:triphosphoribosyl-dephospho-CoA synthase [candidate division NC10 bacterium]
MWSSAGKASQPGTRAAPTGPTASPIALAATLACLLEASAEKVGNVTPSRGFADACFDDFVMSALALGPAIARAEPGRVGWAVWKAVEATRRVTTANTNLGIALLCAPIAAAWRSRGGGTLRQRLARVLRGLTVDDARWAYRAIRLANPSGLGRAGQADVARRPTIPLRGAMALGAERDSIASEYVRDYAITFGITLPALRDATGEGLTVRDAIAQAHLGLLARVPDTLIARKAGRRASEAVSAKSRAVVEAGGMHTPQGRAAARRLDRHLRRDGNRLNPGTSADLVAAALFAGLLEGDGKLLR